MTKFHTTLKKMPILDNEIVQALVRNQIAFDEGKTPEDEDLKLVHKVCWDCLTGSDKVFKLTAQMTGRPAKNGFTNDDIISAYIEINRRILKSQGDAKPLLNAKKIAVSFFKKFSQYNEGKRTIDRHWKNGEKTVSPLSDEDLQEIITPYI